MVAVALEHASAYFVESYAVNSANSAVGRRAHMDEFYLNLGVYNFQAMIERLADDDYAARFEYGRPKKGHNWHHTDWAGIVREIAEHVRKRMAAHVESAQRSH